MWCITCNIFVGTDLLRVSCRVSFTFERAESLRNVVGLPESRMFYACSCINPHSNCLINRNVWAFLQDSESSRKTLISCQPTQMASSEVTQHESCADGDTWFTSLWVIGIILHLSAQHYSNWWLPCMGKGYVRPTVQTVHTLSRQSSSPAAF